MRVSINKNHKENTALMIQDNISSLVEQELPNSLEELRRIKDLAITYGPELVFIFDKSGSVEGTEESMVNHFRKVISKIKVIHPDTLVTLILFNSSDDIIYFRKKASEILPFSYYAEGGTSLYDTLCKDIVKIKEEQIRTTGKVSHTVCTIMTDGDDSTSKKCNNFITRNIISASKKEGWEFIYLAKNLDAAKEAEAIGLEEKNIAIYSDNRNIDKVFSAIEEAINSVYENGSIGESWKTPLANPGKILRLTTSDGE